MASYLITGASRGLGLELTHQLASLPSSEVSKVFATVRGEAPDLESLAKKSSGRVIIIKLDVTNETSIQAAAVEVEAKLEGKGLDILINNAGIIQYALQGLNTMFVLSPHFQQTNQLKYLLGIISPKASQPTSLACTG